MRVLYKRAKSKKKDLSKKHVRILNWTVYTLLLLNFVYFITEPTIIGHDKLKYFSWIILLPILTGTLSTLYFGRRFLRIEFAAIKEPYDKIISGCVLLFFVMVLSFLSLGLIARVTLNYCSMHVADKTPEQVIKCKITKFNRSKRGRSHNIHFLFNNNTESLHVSSKTMSSFKASDTAHYKLEIVIQKGIWNYYVVNYWNIIDKQ